MDKDYLKHKYAFLEKYTSEDMRKYVLGTFNIDVDYEYERMYEETEKTKYVKVGREFKNLILD